MTPVDRASLVLEQLSPGRRRAAELEQTRFDAFCKKYQLSVEQETVTLYLSELLQRERLHAASLRYRLGLLDVTARADGLPPWSANAQIRLFIRGLHAIAPEPPQERRTTPLYVETVRALIDAIDLPTYPQIRHAALLCLAHHARLRVCELHTLRWNDIRIRRGAATLRVHPHRGTRSLVVTVRATGGQTCPIAALKRLYSAQIGASGLVFDRHATTMYRALAAVGYSEGWTQRTLLSNAQLEAAYQRITEPTARQTRDRAIVLLAQAAQLTTAELVSLRVCDADHRDQGLLLTVPGRRNPVGVLHQPDAKYCPVAAWERWCRVRPPTLQGQPDRAFIQVQGEHRLLLRPMTTRSLNGVVHKAAKDAAVVGTWGFGSLRVGSIRTAVRSGIPTHIIATQAGLESLHSVERHQQRERLLTHNVAALLGL